MPLIESIGSGSARGFGLTGGVFSKLSGFSFSASDSTYNYAVFTSTGDLTVATASITADVLTIAGGGSGGSDRAGAGGAGGVVYLSSQLLTPTTYTATVGLGGTPAAAQGTGNSGNNSKFGALTTAVGGGAGGGNAPGLSGGSGGGGRWRFSNCWSRFCWW